MNNLINFEFNTKLGSYFRERREGYQIEMKMREIFDNHGRRINYLRLAVTDRCNLRCFYCMPEEGIKYIKRQELLTYEEMLRLVNIFVGLGIEKLRITGGEPFVRKDMMGFIRNLAKIEGLKKINITTNGTVTTPHIPELKKLGISSVNLSLDSLDRERFFSITRRDELPKVMTSFHQLIDSGIPTKINAVVMGGKNTDDIIPMAELAREYPVDVRFIEEMPFNGSGSQDPKLDWNFRKILEHLKAEYPTIEKLADPPASTAYNFKVPGFKGKIGIIAAFSRTFCGSCNRVRLTPKGQLKTCLYDDGVINLKVLLRAGATDLEVENTLLKIMNNRPKDGFEAEKRRSSGNPVSESMSTIGG